MTGGEILGYFKNGQFFDHTHARARLAPQISKLNPPGGWDLARSRVFIQGSFGGLGAEPPTAGGLAGSRGRSCPYARARACAFYHMIREELARARAFTQGPQAPAGVKGAEPLCFVIAVNRRFKLLVT